MVRFELGVSLLARKGRCQKGEGGSRERKYLRLAAQFARRIERQAPAKRSTVPHSLGGGLKGGGGGSTIVTVMILTIQGSATTETDGILTWAGFTEKSGGGKRQELANGTPRRTTEDEGNLTQGGKEKSVTSEAKEHFSTICGFRECIGGEGRTQGR